MFWKSSTRPPLKRSLLTAAAIGTTAVAAFSAPLTGGAGATGTATSWPTIVLEHGAFADASSWNGVIKGLRRNGYPVVASANPLRGPGSDAAYLRGVLARIDGPVVLVGHSYGGTVISDAAVGQGKVKALVYIAAFLPDVGESSLQLSGKFPGSTLGDAVESTPYTLPNGDSGADLTIRPDRFRAQFAADVPAGEAALMAVTQRPIAVSALEEKSTKAAWRSIPSWSLIATEDYNIPPAAQRFMSKRAHARTVEVKASHAVSVSRPDAVTRLIVQAAKATTK